MIEQPNLQNDAVAEEYAAVVGTLNAYEVILKSDPKAHSEYWDDLLRKRADGTLKDFVANYVIKECSGGKKA